MNVLSLFDGCSTGLFVLKKLGIPVRNYFAAEIDAPAMQVAKANHPEIQHIGDVTKVFAKDLPRIDLIIGGSPCQGFSFAGKRLNLEDPRSKLFWEYKRLVDECRKLNPDLLFFLENVRMDKKSQEVISDALQCEPVFFNSKTISAASRPRLYWTNIAAKPAGLFGRVTFGGHIPAKDTGVVLADILESDVDEKYYLLLEGKEIKYAVSEWHHKKQYTALNPDKALCLKAIGYKFCNGTYISPKQIGSWNGGGQGSRIRRLTPVECERIQGFTDNYTAAASDAQRYKMLGNGWQGDTIELFFRYLKIVKK